MLEDSPISMGLIQSKREQRINVVSIKPTTDKRARTIAQCDLFAGGSVSFEAGAAWLPELKAELLAFPGASMTIRWTRLRKASPEGGNSGGMPRHSRCDRHVLNCCRRRAVDVAAAIAGTCNSLIR